MITLTYSTVDGVYKRRQFKTKAGAKKFVDFWLGDGKGGLMAEISDVSNYAISFDGVGKIDAEGIRLRDMYPEQ
jgi:hypothetical protein